MGRGALAADFLRMVWRRRLWFLIPVLSLILFAAFLLIVLETPALMPFFYAIF